MKKIVFIILLINFFFINNAFAYLDPGTGSIILQAILGAIAAAASYCAFIGIRLRNLFKKILKKRKN